MQVSDLRALLKVKKTDRSDHADAAQGRPAGVRGRGSVRYGHSEENEEAWARHQENEMEDNEPDDHEKMESETMESSTAPPARRSVMDRLGQPSSLALSSKSAMAEVPSSTATISSSISAAALAASNARIGVEED